MHINSAHNEYNEIQTKLATKITIHLHAPITHSTVQLY